MGFKWSLFPIGQKSHSRKRITFTPKQIGIKIENRVFRENETGFYL